MSTTGPDPRLALISSLDLASCRIEFSGRPVVLLCGGRVPPPKPTADDPDPPIGSMRHAITSAWPKFRVFRPEEIKDWHTDGIFKDLVSFELELAAICSLVVIVPESEGSLVELGAFSQLHELSEKSIVICSSQFARDASFINLGILRFLTARNESRVKTYPWEIKRPDSISTELVGDVISDIKHELEKLPGSQVLKTSQRAHASIVICELLRFFVALKENEIYEYIGLMGFEITKDELRGKLFLLENFELIKTQSYSDAIFYMSDETTHHKLRVAFQDKSKKFDALRIDVQCRDFYKNDPKFRNWHRAISQSAKVIL